MSKNSIFIVLLLPHPPFFKQQKLVWSFSIVVALPDFFFKCRRHLEGSILILTFDYVLRISPISWTVSCEKKNEKHKKIPSINSGPVNFKKYKTLDSVETNPSVYWIVSRGVFSLLIKPKNYWKMKTVRKFSKIAAQNFF